MAPKIAFSEIMYHPVLSNADDNNHEFVELNNPGAVPTPIGGWKLSGEVQFTFPMGTTIAAGDFLVVAKNKARLMELTKYNLGAVATNVLGDYVGALDDGGGKILLQDAAGATVDAVQYDDKLPWPLAADGFGAGTGWFSQAQWFPMTSDPRKDFAPHKYLGHSLERVNYVTSATDVANWVPSAMDGATPGRANPLTGMAPPTVTEVIAVFPEGNPTTGLIRATDKVVVRAKVGGGPIAAVELEYYLEFDKAKRVAAPTPAKVPMASTPDGYQAVLPPQGANSTVRYRILVGGKVISPRATDPIPYGYHFYFVVPQVTGKPYYSLLITPENWGRLWTNISPNGPVMGCPSNYDGGCTKCMENPSWNADVPIVFAFVDEANKVVDYTDAGGRYTGSLEGRTFSREIAAATWPGEAPKPLVPAGLPQPPFLALAWKVGFPKYHHFEGVKEVTLNKLEQSCPGFSHFVANALDESDQGGRISAPRVRRWARQFVNGGPFNYVMDVESVGEDYLQRFHGKGKAVGDLYKLFSTGEDLGPWAPGFGGPIVANPSCPAIPVRYRYEVTYKLETNNWRGPDEIMALVTGLAAARSSMATLRDFLTKNFDVDATLKYYAIQQWGAPWDDTGKNYNVYKLPPDAVKPGKGPWTITSWDVDRMFGVDSSPVCNLATSANKRSPVCTIYCAAAGVQGPGCNIWKTAFITTAFRAEYNAKMKELNETIFKPDNMKQIIDAAAAQYDATEAASMAAGAGPRCGNITTVVNLMKTFADARYASVKTQLGY